MYHDKCAIHVSYRNVQGVHMFQHFALRTYSYRVLNPCMLGTRSLYLLRRARVKFHWQHLPWRTAVALIQNAVCKSYYDAINSCRQFQQGARNNVF